MFDDVKANLRGFRTTDWLVVAGVALALWLVLDSVLGGLVGAVVGYLIVIGFRRDAARKAQNRDGPPDAL